MSDQKSIGKPKADVCTNYSPGGYKKPVKPEPEKDRETNEGTVDSPVTAKSLALPLSFILSKSNSLWDTDKGSKVQKALDFTDD